MKVWAIIKGESIKLHAGPVVVSGNRATWSNGEVEVEGEVEKDKIKWIDEMGDSDTEISVKVFFKGGGFEIEAGFVCGVYRGEHCLFVMNKDCVKSGFGVELEIEGSEYELFGLGLA